jgi:nucleoside-diphosphate-sugar epimerase
MGRVVVTGGDGFIGSHLRRRLALAGARDVTVFDLPHGDVREPHAVASALRGASVVYHLAALSGRRATAAEPAAVFETNVKGTFNVLEAAAQARVGRVVFASTYEVYGEPVDLPVDESHPLLALSSFAASKAAAEAYCRAFRRERGLDSVVLRLAEVYGPDDAAGPIPAWISRATDGQNLEVARERISDFVWIDQVVEALLRAAQLEGSVPTINVGSGTGLRHVDVARRVVASAGSASHVRALPAADLRPLRFVADVRRMRDVLHIEPPLDPLSHLELLLPAPTAAEVPLLTRFSPMPALRGVN